MKSGEGTESVVNNTFRIRCDDGTESPETSNVLKLQSTGAGTYHAPAPGTSGQSALPTSPVPDSRQATRCP
eukprot:jgi/Tetstr1/423845/TSEL_014471.t1